jgi:exonuclease SbcC
LAYEHLDLDLTVSHQIAVTGAVGSGKSSLLDAITWALYGKGRASADQMIRQGQGEASVYVDAIVRGEIVQVRRTRKRDRATSLTFHVGGVNRTQHTLAETEDEIERVIGMAYEALMAGPIMVQGKSDELMRVGPSDRRDLLNRLFGLEEYERYHDEAKRRLSTARTEAAQKEAILGELDALITNKENLSFQRLQIQTTVQRLTRHEQAAEDHVVALREEATSLVERERQLHSSIDLVSALEREIEATDETRAERQKASSRLLQQATVIERVPCGGEGIYAACPLLQIAFTARDEIGNITLDDLDQKLLTLAPKLREARKDVMRLSDDAMRIDGVKTQLSDADAAWAKTRSDLEAARDDLIRVESELGRINEASARRATVAREYDEIQSRIGVLEVLAAEFHRNGIPSAILERGLPMIEEESNQVLARMPGGLQIRLATQRETKAKGVKEVLDVVVVRAGAERDYALLSGGQRFRVDFALRLGIAAVLSQRSGSPVDTLWLDEGWGTQDPEGREAMLEALALVADRFGLVVVISHYPEVTDRFPVRLEVRMEDDVSVASLAA